MLSPDTPVIVIGSKNEYEIEEIKPIIRSDNNVLHLLIDDNFSDDDGRDEDEDEDEDDEE
jgi:hypothetical protein